MLSQLLNGNSSPLWLAFILAFLGIAGFVYTAQFIVSEELQTEVVSPWVAELIDKLEDKNIAQPQSKVLDGTNEKLPIKMLKQDSIKKVINPDNSDIAQSQSKVIDGTDEKLLLKTLNQDSIKKVINPENSESVNAKPNDCPPLFFFTFDSSGLQPKVSEKNRKVKKLKTWLEHHPYKVIILEGHSSATGSGGANFTLSYKRAKVVNKFLKEAGIREEQLSIRAFGEDSLLKGIPSTSGKNRRVSMRVDGISECQNYSEN